MKMRETKFPKVEGRGGEKRREPRFFEKMGVGTYLGGNYVFLLNQPLFIMQPLGIPELIASAAAAEICEFVWVGTGV